MSLEERLVLRHVLYPYGPDARLYLLDPVDKQERKTMWYELADSGRSQGGLHPKISFAARPLISTPLKSRSILTRVPPPASTTSSTPRDANRSTTTTQRTGESI